MLPKKGKGFPRRDGKGGGGLSYAEAIAIALRHELGATHQAVKTVMRWTGAGERTAKNWLAGTRGPTGEHLLSLVRQSNAVLEAFLRLAGRESSWATLSLHEARTRLIEMLKNFDELLDQDRSHHGPST
jgi:hypothetical protein